ncbi:bifunctional 4-hydroxy-2-oxoglutarate aldolase/2-dehydro-3-deoxy-phosphogluconate aldolase [Herbiconiux sp. KACC 21604]|uniref:bifunctional 4-hydroxy-2-oxoglutarate aldolase/2-dehydro-3-deoxy-phosphogluconate aldolase n=1 Tax=unclassified Herbiconiux TaxID=2618217 RepID=UPI001491C488|nr:bifunctional 4-hydroxy-2-oxoglutarate aldolase/2-dehydro-3-deoxy-phosphogluconate aldolase [Herbiconiux sp. SALV-R1]QJU55018.1 bifunctional 4-hydroxy-2-oxoglutarate aldolase/2-dehydro-3-deoxy-phosphogluconate aldolase [Herbiconiux sp. SALV-R1]WPO86153.1 bifunctional 4-hydroxy-2-oxoglutarate aldolase/2-dehydro-3-deoxy-phosphogluconate aldolase [Herbiconiux sp. KACC 21604]
MSAFIEALRAARVVAVLRAADEAALAAQLDHAVAGGVRALEITTTGAGWEKVLAAAASSAPEGTLVGAGTVTTTAQVEQALEAGATFLVSPYRVAPAVLGAAGGVPFVQGGFTPAEIAGVAALPGAGTGVAKLFPATTGGIAHLRAVKDVLPEVAIMPTGGISPATAADWLDAGALAVGIGGALFREPVESIRELLRSLSGEQPSGVAGD